MRPPSVTDVLVMRIQVCLGDVDRIGQDQGNEWVKRTHSEAGAWKRTFRA